MAQASKIDVPEQHWDALFAPSSCLVMITTVDAQGRVNAASYGSCVRISHEPVQIAFSPRNNNDTYRNLRETGEFVVNIPAFEERILEQVRVVGLPFERGVNELEKAGLTELASRTVKPPRIAECKSHFECKVLWTKEWLNRAMVVGEVVAASADSDCMTDGRLVWERAKPAHYCGAPYGNMFVASFQTMAVGMPYTGPEAEAFEKDRLAMLDGKLITPEQEAASDPGELIGTWKQISGTMEEVGTGVVENSRKSPPNGYVNFSADGRLMLISADSVRQKPAGEVATAAEAEALYRSLIAYAGSYRISGNQVFYELDLTWNEAWTGTKHMRYWKIEGGRLMISTPEMVNPWTGKRSVMRLSFQKVQ